MIWTRSTRGDPAARPMADRHYNRQKPGTPQFVPPGRCLVLAGVEQRALWVSSWPQFARHVYVGAWVNTLFRREGPGPHPVRASEMILAAIAHTRAEWPTPEKGMVTYVDPKAVPGVVHRGERVYGFSYLMAGFRHVGFSSLGLWAWQILPAAMPGPEPVSDLQGELWPSSS